ncbi:MAG: glycosyltransferase family 2 protein [Planctomycetales bacterium]|nr:glycosyltransferase family 2 protein [Planctomycetales bacterium]
MNPASDPSDIRKVSIAICTWNRCRLLEKTLDTLTRLQVPAEVDWEVIVVNNASTDATPTVIDSFVDRLPVRRVDELQQGHSHARNAAVANISGDLLLWTDDDVRVEPNWLAAYVAAANQQTDVGFWGGTIEPDFESEPPRWVMENWEMSSRIYALRDWRGEVPSVDLKHLPFGANFAIRATHQRSYGFDVNFGRKGEGMRGFDEVDVFRRMLDAGVRGAWVPAARVHHHIPTDRLTLDYVRRYYEGQGETLVVRGESHGSDAELTRRMKNQEFWFRVKRWFGSSRSWIPCLIEAARLRGQLKARGQKT